MGKSCIVNYFYNSAAGCLESWLTNETTLQESANDANNDANPDSYGIDDVLASYGLNSSLTGIIQTFVGSLWGHSGSEFSHQSIKLVRHVLSGTVTVGVGPDKKPDNGTGAGIALRAGVRSTLIATKLV